MAMSDPGSSTSILLTLRCPRGLDRKLLRAFAEQLQEELAGNMDFSFLLTDDRELRRLNHQFLKKDYATDVLSFPGEDPREFLGEIAISVQRAAEQAAAFGHSTEDEIRILMLHGVLHLLGMDHETDDGKMASAEKSWRNILGLPSGLIERAAL